MTDETSNKPVLQGELLPESRRSVSLAPEIAHLPQGMLGIGFFARARYASEQKQFESYTRLVQAKNDLIGALTEQRRLAIGFAIEGERARNLPDLLEAAKLEIQQTIAGIRRAGELDGLRFENEKEQLLFENDRLRRARQDFNTPPTGPSGGAAKKPSLADGFDEVGKEIEKVEKAYDQFRDELIKRAGGEQNLTEDQRHRLKQFELLRNKLLNEAMEALF